MVQDVGALDRLMLEFKDMKFDLLKVLGFDKLREFYDGLFYFAEELMAQRPERAPALQSMLNEMYANNQLPYSAFLKIMNRMIQPVAEQQSVQ
jgi:hypothetical protein